MIAHSHRSAHRGSHRGCTRPPTLRAGAFTTIVFLRDDDATVVIKDVERKAPVLGGIHDALWRVRRRRLFELVEQVLGQLDDYRDKVGVTSVRPLYFIMHDCSSPWKFSTTREGVTLFGRTMVYGTLSKRYRSVGVKVNLRLAGRARR